MSAIYTNVPRTDIAATTRLLRWFREFIRSPQEVANDPTRGEFWFITREEAQSRLAGLVNVAINRKAGKSDADYPMHYGEAVEVSRVIARMRRDDPELPVRTAHFSAPMLRALRRGLRGNVTCGSFA